MAKRRASRHPTLPVHRVQNDERPLPADLAASFDEALGWSYQAEQAKYELQASIAGADAHFRREQRRLVDAMAKQLGISSAMQELESLREGHVKAVMELIETAAKSALESRSAGDRTTQTGADE
jgi:hypothetical protein